MVRFPLSACQTAPDVWSAPCMLFPVPWHTRQWWTNVSEHPRPEFLAGRRIIGTSQTLSTAFWLTELVESVEETHKEKENSLWACCCSIHDFIYLVQCLLFEVLGCQFGVPGPWNISVLSWSANSTSIRESNWKKRLQLNIWSITSRGRTSVFSFVSCLMVLTRLGEGLLCLRTCSNQSVNTQVHTEKHTSSAAGILLWKMEQILAGIAEKKYLISHSRIELTPHTPDFLKLCWMMGVSRHGQF